MKQLFFLLLAIGSTFTSVAQTSRVRYPKLSKTLDSLAYVDQWPMQRLMEQQPDSAGRNLFEVEKLNFAHHQPLLEKIIKQYGYPGFKQVGEKSSSNFWLLVQHADAYPDFQRQVLKLMLAEVKNKNASSRNYAYLTDRVALNAGQPQEYGTQVEFKGSGIGKAMPRNLRDPEHVNQRRAAMGLETEEAYLKMSDEMHEHMNKPKSSNL
jgi:hypothetical protein